MTPAQALAHEEAIRAAEGDAVARVVRRYARDHKDAAELLDALGLTTQASAA